MIDWVSVGANALWVLGCAVALAVLSYASWEASQYHEKFRVRLGKPGLQAALNLGGFLFACGLAATSDRVLETGLWLLLAGLFLLQVFTAWKRLREHAS